MPRPKKEKKIDPLTEARLKIASYDGFLSRLHGHLHLKMAVTSEEKFDMLRKWLSEQINSENKKPVTRPF